MLPAEDLQYADRSERSLLRVTLLGVPQVSWNGNPLVLVRRQVRVILFRLAYAAAPVGREELADLLWPNTEPAAARRNLVRLLSMLRGELPSRDLLMTNRTAVWLDPTCFSSDVHDFVRLSSSDADRDWESGIALYRGPFLSGSVLSDSPTFDEWQQSTSYDLERQYLEILARLVKKSQSTGLTRK